ncbi:hypothetical protein ES703_115617 [subsurface metagenome]
MRTKDEIIGNIFHDLETAQNLGHIEKAVELPLLEVLIDIRDILDKRLVEINKYINKILLSVDGEKKEVSKGAKA